jgi:hypothetical protein
MAIGGGTDSLSQNVCNYQSAVLNIPEKQRSQHKPIYIYCLSLVVRQLCMAIGCHGNTQHLHKAMVLIVGKLAI